MYRKLEIEQEEEERLEVTVYDWEKVESILLLPLRVAGDKEMKFVFRLEADDDVLDELIEYIDVEASNIESDDAEDDGSLVFYNFNGIVNTVVDYASNTVDIRVWFKTGAGTYNRLYDMRTLLTLHTNEAAKSIEKSISSRVYNMAVDRIGENVSHERIGVQIKVKPVRDIIVGGHPKAIFHASFRGIASMVWDITCYLDGEYLCTYTYRIEMEGAKLRKAYVLMEDVG